MADITIKMPDGQLEDLKERAESIGVEVEDLIVAVLAERFFYDGTDIHGCSIDRPFREIALGGPRDI